MLKLKVLDRSLCLLQVYAPNATSEYQAFVDEVNDALLRVSATESTVLKEDFNRGGVEDTKLEAKAKAKDTKKIRGQGQPFRGQALSRPRTGMLESKDHGHKRKCSPKKRSSQKFFRRSPKKKNLHEITFSKKFFKRYTKF